MGQESAQLPEGDSKLEALRDRIEAALRDPLDEQWTEVLNQWEDGSPSERKAVRVYASGLRDRLLDGLRALQSFDALKRGLAFGYVEMKGHWTRLTTQIQEQTARGDQAAEPLLYRAVCVGLIVQALDSLLTRESVEGVADVLVESLS